MKKSSLHIDKELYKKAKYNNYRKLLSEYIGKPKTLSETLKSLDMPKKTLTSNANALKSNNALTFDKNLRFLLKFY